MSIHRSISNDHTFFDECLQLYLLKLATFAIGLHYEAQRDAMHFAEITNRLFSAFKARADDPAKEISAEIAGEWDLPDFPALLCWQSPGSDEDCLLHNTQALVDFARRGEKTPTSLEFDVVPTLQSLKAGKFDFPEAPDGLVAVESAVPTSLFETVLAYLIGGAFERFNEHFRCKYGSVAGWPAELQFFRHLRNGCFHRNQFRIDQYKGQDQIDPANPPRWHSYSMPSDSKMNGLKVIGQNAFFHAPHVLMLLDDMSFFV